MVVEDRAVAHRAAAVLPAAEATAAAEAIPAAEVSAAAEPTPAAETYRAGATGTAGAEVMLTAIVGMADFAEATMAGSDFTVEAIPAMGIRVRTTDTRVTMAAIIQAIITTMAITALRITPRPTTTSQRRCAARRP